MNTIGQHLKQFRKTQNIPVPKLAETLNVSRQHVYRIEHGARTSMGMLEKISALIGVPIDQLFKEPKRRRA